MCPRGGARALLELRVLLDILVGGGQCQRAALVAQLGPQMGFRAACTLGPTPLMVLMVWGRVGAVIMGAVALQPIPAARAVGGGAAAAHASLVQGKLGFAAAL